MSTRTKAAKPVPKQTAKPAAAKNKMVVILSAPRGKRTLTHGKIKRAVESIFEERYGADG